MRCVLVIYAGAVAITATSYAEFVAHMHVWVTVLLALGAAIDVVIAGAMIYFLLTKRERSHMRTARLIDRLIAFTLRTGLVTRCATDLYFSCSSLSDLRNGSVWPPLL